MKYAVSSVVLCLYATALWTWTKHCSPTQSVVRMPFTLSKTSTVLVSFRPLFFSVVTLLLTGAEHAAFFEPVVQFLLVVLYPDDVVIAGGYDCSYCLLLGVQRIGGEDDAGQSELFDQSNDERYLIGLVADFALQEHLLCLLGEDTHQVGVLLLGSTGCCQRAADTFAVQGQPVFFLNVDNCFCPSEEHLRELCVVQVLHHPGDGLVGRQLVMLGMQRFYEFIMVPTNEVAGSALSDAAAHGCHEDDEQNSRQAVLSALASSEIRDGIQEVEECFRFSRSRAVDSCFHILLYLFYVYLTGILYEA